MFIGTKVFEGDHPHVRWIGARLKEAVKDGEEWESGFQYFTLVLKDESHIFNCLFDSFSPQYLAM